MGRKEIVCQGYFMFCLPAYFKKAGLPLGTFKKKKMVVTFYFSSVQKRKYTLNVYMYKHIYIIKNKFELVESLEFSYTFQDHWDVKTVGGNLLLSKYFQRMSYTSRYIVVPNIVCLSHKTQWLLLVN